MASNLNFNDNGFRVSKLLVDGGGYLTKQMLLQNAISGTITTLDQFLAEPKVKQTIKKLKFQKHIHAPQYAIIYPPKGKPTNLDDWDITLVTLIFKNCLTPSPAEYIAIQDIREIRNTLYGHTSKVEMTDTQFQQNWTNITSTLINHFKLLTNPSGTKSIQDLITTISTETLSAGKTIETLKNWYEWDMDVKERIDDVKEKIDDVKEKIDDVKESIDDVKESIDDVKESIDKLPKEQTERFKEAETKSYERHRATQDKLLDIETLQNNAPDELILKLDKYYKEQNVDRVDLNRKIAQAKNILEAHQRDLDKYGFSYKTRMTDELTQRLKRNKIVVLKGVQGSGKTHLAKNILVQFSSLNPELSPLVIRTPSEIEKVLDPTGSFVLLVDDLIGTNSFDAIEYKDWSQQYIENLLSQVAVGTLFVVMTIRTSIYMRCQGQKFSKLFEEPNVLDVGDCLLANEKQTIFEKFAKYHNEDVSRKPTKLILQKKSIGIGFPLLCKMMKVNDVDQLFQSPVHYLKTEMLRIKEEFTIGFVVLFMTLVGDGILSKTSLTENQLSCFQTLQTFFKANQMDSNELYKAAISLKETYFNFNDTESKFSFIHEAIAQSIVEAALECFPHILIKYCPFDSLIRNLNLLGETSISEVMKPNPYLVHKQLIVERMIEVMSSSESTLNIQNIASASIWKHEDFADAALPKFQMTYFYQEDDNESSMLCHFASLGLTDLLKNIISRSMNLKKLEIHNQIKKALERACLEGQIDCVKYLLSKVGEILPEHVFASVEGADIEILKLIISEFGEGNIDTLKQKNTDKTILHIAAEVGRINIVKYLHTLYPEMLLRKDKNGWIVIHSSSNTGKIECLKYFVQNGVDGNLRTKEGETLLHVAAEGGHIETIEYILKCFPDMVKMIDFEGRTIAHSAAKGGSIDSMQLLIENGVDPIQKARDGTTIIQVAAAAGNYNLLKYLCDRCEELVQETDNSQYNILHYAAMASGSECMQYLIENYTHLNKTKINYRKKSAVNIILKPNNKTRQGHTILHISAFNGSIYTLTYICETCPDLLRLSDNNNRHALHAAAHKGNSECLKYLVDHGLNPRDKTGEGETILHRAALGGNMNTMTFICETYPDMLQVTDNDGRNALHKAAHKGTVKCMIYLVKHGLNPRDKTGEGDTILHQAALGGNMNTMTYICETYPALLQLTNNKGRNALHKAANMGTVKCLKYLVKHGLNPRDKTGDGDTILHQAALGGNMNKMTYICETYPGLLQLTDNKGRNALHNAAYGGTIECLKYLVDHELNPSNTTGDGETILHQAALGGNMTTMTYIGETYPDLLQLTNNGGRNALHDAADKGTIECLKYLVDHGLNPRDKKGDGDTILHQAALGGNINTMTYICETYPDLVHLTDNRGRNALHKAANQGTVKCILYLVKHGLNPRDKTGEGDTILHRAALGGNMNTMTYICDTYPGLLQLTDNKGCNALHDAAYGGTVECLKYLVDHELNPRDKDGDGDTILHPAALGGNMNTMTYICETYPDLLKLTKRSQKQALRYARRSGSEECYKYLIYLGLKEKKTCKLM